MGGGSYVWNKKMEGVKDLAEMEGREGSGSDHFWQSYINGKPSQLEPDCRVSLVGVGLCYLRGLIKPCVNAEFASGW